jgi:hypothetical protein
MLSHDCQAGVVDNQIYAGKDNYGWYYCFSGHEAKNHCFWCGIPVKRRYCSPQHKYLYLTFYHWNEATENVLVRIYKKEEGYVCEMCGIGQSRWEGAIQIHHIIPVNGGNRNWSKLNTPDNLIGLCKDCHINIHRHKAKKVNTEAIIDHFGYNDAIIDHFGYNDADSSEKNRIIGEVIDVIQSHEPKEHDAPDECNCFWWLKRKFTLIIEEQISIDCVFVTDKLDHDGKWTVFDLDIVGNYILKYVDELQGKWIKAIMPKGEK